MAIRNTSTQDPLVQLFAAMGNGGIAAQEARGQRELETDSALPTEGLDKLPSQWGIQVIGPRKSDPIFTDVILPAGWKVQPTDHSMWSDLVDAGGAKRASIFYKAAFYDRSAFIRAAVGE